MVVIFTGGYYVDASSNNEINKRYILPAMGKRRWLTAIQAINLPMMFPIMGNYEDMVPTLCDND